MSWLDDIKRTPFEITTGDKKQWYPLLIPNYVKNIEFNGTQYDFIERAGSLFARRLPKGRSYPLEFAFRGADNVKIANAFEQSARDTRPWVVVHPFFGEITVQPLSLVSNSSGFDSTVIQVQVVETIVANQPKEAPDYADMISNAIKDVQDASLVSINSLPGTIPVKNQQTALKITDNLAAKVKTITKLESERKAYQKWYRNAVNELNNATGLTQEYLTNAYGLVMMPSIVTSDIGTRFSLLINMMTYLGKHITGIVSPSYFERLFYNLMGSTMITAFCKALTVKNAGDFQSRSDVQHFINIVLEQYDTYLEKLYNLEDEAFKPDHDLMFAMHTLVYESVSFLYQIMFEAKQERTHYPARDINIILLAHRLYGKASEDNIQSLKASNKIGLSEILKIQKGRPIKYYV